MFTHGQQQAGGIGVYSFRLNAEGTTRLFSLRQPYYTEYGAPQKEGGTKK